MQLSDFITYVRRDFKRTDKNTEIIRAYNDMIVWVSLWMPIGNYKYQSWVHTVVGQEDYSIPSNAIHLTHPIKILDGTGSSDSGYPLQHLTKEEYDIYEPNPNRTSPSTGKPYGYTIYSRSILLTPLPDSAEYLLEINWSKRPVSQSADADTTELGTEWDETLKFGTLDRLYAGLGLYEDSLYWASKYRDAEHRPIGMCKRLLDIERDREGVIIGQVKFNQL